jgi:hypothetical protein
MIAPGATGPIVGAFVWFDFVPLAERKENKCECRKKNESTDPVRHWWASVGGFISFVTRRRPPA